MRAKPLVLPVQIDTPLGKAYGHTTRHGRIACLLATVADKVLAHKPKPKSKPARKRARRAKKIAQAADV